MNIAEEERIANITLAGAAAGAAAGDGRSLPQLELSRVNGSTQPSTLEVRSVQLKSPCAAHTMPASWR